MMGDVMIEEKPPLFELDERIFESMDEDEIHKTFIDMREMGLNKPPFPSLVMRLSNRLLRLFFKPDFNEDKHFDEIDAAYVWIRYDEATGAMGTSFGVQPRGQKIDWITDTPPQAVAKEIYRLSYRVLVILIVILATKNIEKETRVNSDRASSHRIREYARDFSTTTVIRIGKITETMRGASSGVGTKTRPHLRRGHIRNQRHGENWSETRQIFIAPVFVNADDNWIAEQKTYKVMA